VDKGNVTVIFNTEDYARKTATLLEDPEYRRLDKNPTDAVDRKTSALIKMSSLLK
jgi:hypothetical protein